MLQIKSVLLLPNLFIVSVLFFNLGGFHILGQKYDNTRNLGNQNCLATVRVFVPPISLDNPPLSGLPSNLDNILFRVFLQSNNFTKEMIYKKNGVFELDVPKGFYQIKLKAIDGSVINYKRANFYAELNQSTEIRILPVEGDQVCDIEEGLVLNVIPLYKKQKRDYTSPKYDDFLVKDPFNVVIKYCLKINKKRTITYRFAQLSFNKLTIYADSISFNKQNKIIEATGNVWVEVGKCGKERNKIRLDLKKIDLSKFICNDLQTSLN